MNKSPDQSIQENWRADDSACRQAGQLYAAHLQDIQNGPIRNKSAPFTAYWTLSPECSPAELHHMICDASQKPQATVLKETDRISVTRTVMDEKEVIIKRYKLDGMLETLKYLVRPSRARRFWAAARTLMDLDIPTAAPFGFLECWENHVPAVSYIVTEFIPDADDASTWMGRQFFELPGETRESLVESLMNRLIDLYRHGIYHRDTKTSNLLIKHPLQPELRELLWVDLECVACGIRPNRHQIMRNIVQIVGSLGPEATCEEREYIIHIFASTFPWLTQNSNLKRIHCWTDRRMHKERGCCLRR